MFRFATRLYRGKMPRFHFLSYRRQPNVIFEMSSKHSFGITSAAAEAAEAEAWQTLELRRRDPTTNISVASLDDAALIGSRMIER